MPWLDYFSYFFGGAFLANTVPHFVAGISGRPFQSPFARPRGQGLSSSTVNVVWAFANAIVAYLLLLRVGSFDLRDTGDVIALGLGMALLAFGTANYFGRFNGGNNP
jgi:hypothetical protein